MGVVDAAERGEVVFFVVVVFGVFVVLCGKFEGFSLVVGEGVLVDVCDVFFEHDDVFLHSGFFVHGLGVYGRWCGDINVCIGGVFIVFEAIKCFVGWQTTKCKGI
jgi:hypothetical protein